MKLDYKYLTNIKDEYIIVGVSAGPDSMALLDLLLKQTNKKIICCHINHNIRKESQEEAQYLKDYCKNNNIIFEYKKLGKYKGTNLENEARIKRYQFYEEILSKYNSHYLFLAHHGNDLIETVLMKIVRGSNLEGYAGIKEYSHQKNYTIVRPLLKYSKDDILEYNKDNNITYFIDNTNDDESYTRNRYRKQILPILKNEDSLIHQKFLKYSNTLQEYYNYIEDVVKEKIKENYQDNTIDINIFNKEHPFIKKNIIFYLLSETYDNTGNIIKDKHIDDILKLIDSKKPNSYVTLPKGYIAKKIYNKVIICKKNRKSKSYKQELNDINNIDGLIIKRINDTTDNGNNICRLNSKSIKLPLYIRNRKNGDTIEVLGLNAKKKVSDIFIDNKVPKDLRDTYPLLVDSNDNILWIPNLKKSKYNAKFDEFYDIILTSYEESEEKNEKENK